MTPDRAGAADGPAPAVQRIQHLENSCTRLRAELERANQEISALKRGERGVGDDYRLRRRMADAEQLARQLTAAEAELRRLRTPAPQAPAVAPVMEPAEAPAVLEARADLLSDQARRLGQQAAGLERAALQLRNRQTLRRRAGQVERDPFGSMDGSKRFMVVRGVERTATRNPTPDNFNPPPSDTNSGNSSGSGAAPASLTPEGSPAVPGTTGGGPQGGTSDGKAGPSPLSGGGDPTSRVLLDPAVSAELQRLDGSLGAPRDEAEKLQRAAAALTRRAQALESEARTLRTRAAKR